jgi:hypothetical protein
MSIRVYSVFVLGSGLCDGLITRPRGLAECLRLRN